MSKHYIFRWKAKGLGIPESRHKTEQAVWDYAITFLRPMRVKSDEEAERIVRLRGEVVEDA